MQNFLFKNSPLPLPLKKALGEILVEAGLVSVTQIELALQEQKHKDLRIGEILNFNPELRGWKEKSG